MGSSKPLKAEQSVLTSAPSHSSKRRRLSPETRQEKIIDEATAYFAENGLTAGTVDLARRMGTTQPLIYRYFATKDALIDSVYERLLDQNWNPDWGEMIVDSSRPLLDRLSQFYIEYSQRVLTYNHVRLFLFSGLTNRAYNRRYYRILAERIFNKIVLAFRDETGMDISKEITRKEVELIQSIHGVVFHVAYRRWVHDEDFGMELEDIVRMKVKGCLAGILEAFATLEDEDAQADATEPPSKAAG